MTNIFDGRHVTDGPYLGMEIAALDDDALEYTRELTAQVLDAIKASQGCCPVKPWRDVPWEVVNQAEPNFRGWLAGKKANILGIYDTELRRRERLRREAERQRDAQLALAQADAALFDEKEQRQIREQGLIDLWEQCAQAGFRRKAFEDHPDQGGSHEAMQKLNLGRRLFQKVIRALKTELSANESEK